VITSHLARREELGSLWTGTTAAEEYNGWTSGSVVTVGPSDEPEKQQDVLLVWRLDGVPARACATARTHARTIDVHARSQYCACRCCRHGGGGGGCDDDG